MASGATPARTQVLRTLIAAVALAALMFMPVATASAEESASPEPTPSSINSSEPAIEAAAEVGDVTTQVAMAACSSDSLPVEITFANHTQEPVEISWRVVGENGEIASGNSVVVDKVVIDLAEVATGPYQVEVVDPATELSIDSTPFRVIECVDAESECGQVTFTNPAINPPLEVLVERNSGWEPFEVASGESVTVDSSADVLKWEVRWVDGVARDAGSGKIELDQDCEPMLPDLGIRVECTPPGQSQAEVNYSVERWGESGPLSWILTNEAGEVVAQGDIPASGQEFEEGTIPGLGIGQYELVLNAPGHVAPVDSQPFVVRTCITATVECGAVTFHNSEGNGLVEVWYGERSETGREGMDTVPAGESLTIETTRELLSWSAFSDGVGYAGHAGIGDEVVPQDCATPSPTIQPSAQPTTTTPSPSAAASSAAPSVAPSSEQSGPSSPVAPGGLADTGTADSLLPIALAAIALLVAGFLTIDNRRIESR